MAKAAARSKVVKARQVAFKTTVAGMGPKKAWCFLPVPVDLKAMFGKVRVPVRGTINGFPFRTTILSMGGKNWIQFNKALQEGAKAKVGDRVKVVLQADDQPRTVELPPDLARTLTRKRKARAAYQKLAYSHRKRYVDWVTQAKTEETRQRRAGKMVAMLLRGKTLD